MDCLRTSIICGVYHIKIRKYCSSANENQFQVEKVFTKIFKSSHLHFINTIFVTIFTYTALGFLTPIPSISLMSFVFPIYMIIGYLIFVTFFASCLMLNLKRLKKNRHCFTCCKMPENQYDEIHQKKKYSGFFKRYLKISPSKNPKLFEVLSIFVVIGSLAIFALSLYVIYRIDTKLYDDRFLPRNATSLRSYMKSQTEDYDIGPIIMFTLPHPVSYRDENFRNRIIDFSKTCLNDSNTNNFRLVWLEKENVDEILNSRKKPEQMLTPYSRNDLAFSFKRKNVNIKASRFYCQYRTIKGHFEH